MKLLIVKLLLNLCVVYLDINFNVISSSCYIKLLLHINVCLFIQHINVIQLIIFNIFIPEAQNVYNKRFYSG